MGKTVHCKCKSGCSNRRCVCLRNNEPCDESCGCSNCENPLNGMDVEALSICTIQNIEEYKNLSSDELEEKYKLPCGCEQVPLKDLLGDYIMIFLQLAGFFQLFLKYVCPASSVPGSRLDVQRTGGILFDGLLSILF